MIKEYEEVKLFVDRYTSCRFLESVVVVDEIFTEEYNALDISITGDVDVTTGFYNDLRISIKKKFGKIIEDLEILRESYSKQVSIIVYLRPTMEIRSEKIQKIKSKILI